MNEASGPGPDRSIMYFSPGSGAGLGYDEGIVGEDLFVPSLFTKWCLTLPAVSPALGAASIIAITSHNSWSLGILLALAGVLFAFISYLIILFVRKYVMNETLRVSEMEQADQKVLEFLLTYLLPVFSSTSLTTLVGSMALTAYSLFVAVLVIIHGNIFQFNPVLALFGYHFIIIKTCTKIIYLLITKGKYHKAERELTVQKISDFIYLDSTP